MLPKIDMEAFVGRRLHKTGWVGKSTGIPGVGAGVRKGLPPRFQTDDVAGNLVRPYFRHLRQCFLI